MEAGAARGIGWERKGLSLSLYLRCIGARPLPRGDVMKRIAAPIGGVVTSFLLKLVVYPVIFEVWRGWSLQRSASRFRLSSQ